MSVHEEIVFTEKSSREFEEKRMALPDLEAPVAKLRRTKSTLGTYAEIKHNLKVSDDQIQVSNQYLVCQSYVLNELHKYSTTTSKDINRYIVDSAIHEILKAQANPDNLIRSLTKIDQEIKRVGEQSERLTKFLFHLRLQIKELKYLTSVNDSDIIPSSIGKHVLNTDNPHLFSTERFAMLINTPNKYNNPAESAGLAKEILDEINFRNDLSIIFVSGGTANPYGHAILKLGNHGYIHINTLFCHPQYIRDANHFSAYLKAQGGRITGIQNLKLDFPEAAKALLLEVSQDRWLWGITHNNCLSFVHFIAFAGGVMPSALGYLDNDIHQKPKLPWKFALHLKDTPDHNVEHRQTGSYKYHTEQLSKKLGDLFKDTGELVRSREELIHYYASLRCNGLDERDALKFTKHVYQLEYTEWFKCKKRGSALTRAVYRAPELALDNGKALLGAARTSFFGDKRVGAQEEDPLAVPVLRRTFSAG